MNLYQIEIDFENPSATKNSNDVYILIHLLYFFAFLRIKNHLFINLTSVEYLNW